MRLWLGPWLWLCLGPLWASEARIDFQPPSPDPSSWLAALSALSGDECVLDPALATELGSAQEGLVLTSQAPLLSVHQAIAHAWACWWVGDGPTWRFTRARTLPVQGALSVRVTTSLLPQAADYLPLAQRVLAPWLGNPAAGLLCDPSGRRWTAQLDAAGHTALLQFFACLEHPQAVLPPLPAPPDLPANGRDLQAPIAGTSLRSLLETLHQRCAISLSATALALAQPLAPDSALAPARLDLLPVSLQGLGLQAAWRQGVLCVDVRTIEERQHPAAQLTLLRLPAHHLARSQDAGRALATQLQQALGREAWDLPGHSLVWLPSQHSLLLTGSPRLVREACRLWQSWDRAR